MTIDSVKISIDPGENFYETGKKIKYYSGSAIFPKTIKTAEVKEIIDGPSLYKIFALDDKRQPHLYKIVAQAPDKRLLVRFIEPAANSTSGGLGMVYYVVSGTGTVLASGEMPAQPPSRNSHANNTVIEKLTSYFSNCPAVMANLGKGSTTQPDGTQTAFTENIPLGFKVQKGVYRCD